jgi:hypothetical protein
MPRSSSETLISIGSLVQAICSYMSAQAGKSYSEGKLFRFGELQPQNLSYIIMIVSKTRRLSHQCMVVIGRFVWAAIVSRDHHEKLGEKA